ncbi:hypothetical protein MMC07_006814 [Pseudocyphellaria aurata]|nr:hypothetical protein [Pseudocyphellaria aurata]
MEQPEAWAAHMECLLGETLAVPVSLDLANTQRIGLAMLEVQVSAGRRGLARCLYCLPAPLKRGCAEQKRNGHTPGSIFSTWLLLCADLDTVQLLSSCMHLRAPLAPRERREYPGHFHCKAVSLIRKHWPALELRPEEVQLYNNDRGKLLLKRICEGHQQAGTVTRPRLPAEVFDKIMKMLVHNSTRA